MEIKDYGACSNSINRGILICSCFGLMCELVQRTKKFLILITHTILLSCLVVLWIRTLEMAFRLDEWWNMELQLFRFKEWTFSKNEKVSYSHHAYDSAKLLGSYMDKNHDLRSSLVTCEKQNSQKRCAGEAAHLTLRALYIRRNRLLPFLRMEQSVMLRSWCNSVSRLDLAGRR